MNKSTILIVDDEINIRNGLSTALKLEGFNTLTAEDGINAWEIINKQPIDLVLTDIRMPKMDGNELLKKISSSYPTVPVIMLTGHGTIEEAVKSMQNGAVDLLTKPVNLSYLNVLIHKTLHDNEIKKNQVWKK